MAKKYLLYIHDSERFDKENNKSALINKLLENHYNPKSRGGVNIQESPKIKNEVNNFLEGRDLKTCKKGHLYKGDKCMQKDCV